MDATQFQTMLADFQTRLVADTTTEMSADHNVNASAANLASAQAAVANAQTANDQAVQDDAAAKATTLALLKALEDAITKDDWTAYWSALGVPVPSPTPPPPAP